MRLPVRNSSARASEAAGALTDEVQDLDRIAEPFQTRSTISDARQRAT
ncbi:hypothetical protein [Rhizobium vallis]|nr:hypothetical protein [Rhizobium vallis]